MTHRAKTIFARSGAPAIGGVLQKAHVVQSQGAGPRQLLAGDGAPVAVGLVLLRDAARRALGATRRGRRISTSPLFCGGSPKILPQTDSGMEHSLRKKWFWGGSPPNWPMHMKLQVFCFGRRASDSPLRRLLPSAHMAPKSVPMARLAEFTFGPRQ